MVFKHNEHTSPPQPNRSLSEIEKVGGKAYVVLRNINGVLAVYRIRNDGMLKGLRRWPAELDPETVEEVAERASEEAYEEGYEKGYEAGEEKGYEAGYEKGYEKGYEEASEKAEEE